MNNYTFLEPIKPNPLNVSKQMIWRDNFVLAGDLFFVVRAFCVKVFVAFSSGHKGGGINFVARQPVQVTMMTNLCPACSWKKIAIFFKQLQTHLRYDKSIVISSAE